MSDDVRTYAVLDADGKVVNTILADAAFIAALGGMITDPEVDTGDLTSENSFYDITDKDPQPTTGWTRAGNGKFTAPPPPSEAELASIAQRAADGQFLADLRTKRESGYTPTAEEMNRLSLIQLDRGAI